MSWEARPELFQFVERRIQAIFPNTDTADEVMSVVSNTVMIEGGMNVRSSLSYPILTIKKPRDLNTEVDTVCF